MKHLNWIMGLFVLVVLGAGAAMGAPEGPPDVIEGPEDVVTEQAIDVEPLLEDAPDIPPVDVVVAPAPEAVPEPPATPLDLLLVGQLSPDVDPDALLSVSLLDLPLAEAHPDADDSLLSGLVAAWRRLGTIAPGELERRLEDQRGKFAAYEEAFRAGAARGAEYRARAAAVTALLNGSLGLEVDTESLLRLDLRDKTLREALTVALSGETSAPLVSSPGAPETGAQELSLALRVLLERSPAERRDLLDAHRARRNAARERTDRPMDAPKVPAGAGSSKASLGSASSPETGPVKAALAAVKREARDAAEASAKADQAAKDAANEAAAAEQAALASPDDVLRRVAEIRARLLGQKQTLAER